MQTVIRRGIWPLYVIVLAAYTGVQISSYQEASARLESYAMAGQQAATAYDITGSADTELANETGMSSTAVAVLQKQADLGRTIRRIVAAGAVLGVISFLVYAWAEWQRRAKFSL